MEKTINEKADLIIHYYKQICELVGIDPGNPGSSITLMIHGIKYIASLDSTKWRKEADVMNDREVFFTAKYTEGSITLFGDQRFSLEKEPIEGVTEEQQELNDKADQLKDILN